MSSLYIEAPNSTFGVKNFLFIAGGISDCPDWQKDVSDKLLTSLDNITVLNPRRKNFPIHDPSAAETQITWEYLNLTRANAILFWFPKETLCPIVLYELGFQLGRFITYPQKYRDELPALFIGTHPEYQRRLDVIVQAKLAGFTGKVHDNLDNVVDDVIAHFSSKGS